MLVPHRGLVFLNGLTTLSEEVAKSLVRLRNGGLYLDGLTTLSDAVAQTLTQHKGNLSLKGLDSLEPAAAESLVKGLDCRRCHADVSTPDLLNKECRGLDPRRRILLTRGITVEPGR
jgi:hypothetical protein